MTAACGNTLSFTQQADLCIASMSFRTACCPDVAQAELGHLTHPPVGEHIVCLEQCLPVSKEKF